jgi:DNA-binding SARP family transcriptional activator/TolB-like protein
LVLRLVTFGDLRLTDSQGRAIAYPEKALIALCYLLASKAGERTRSDVAQFLWDDVDPSRASANLRTLLLRAKNQQAEIGAELLVIRDTSIRANIAAFDSDLMAIENAGTDPVARLQAFFDHCQGQFLVGADDFSECGRNWVTAQRDNIISRFAAALDAVATTETGTQRALILESAHRLLALDPHCEMAYRALMKAYAAGGQLNSVTATFDRLQDRLKKAPPEQSTVDLWRALIAAKPLPAIPAGPVASDINAGVHRVHLPRVLLLPPVHASDESMLPGLIEDVTLGLCTFKTISMVAPHTADRIVTEDDRGAAYDRHAIAYALDTRVSVIGGREALFAQLVDVRNDTTVWAERYDASTEQLPRQYQAIARRIAASTAGRIEENEVERLGFEQHPNAYQYYLMGQRFLKRIDLPDIRRARKAFKLAVRQDPGFSAALAGLARTDHIEYLLTAQGDAALLQSAEQNAAEAIRTQSEGSGGYRELGVAKLFQHRFDESIEAFEKAEAASPSHADLIADYADTLIHSSDPVRGLAKIELAIELNPLAPDIYHWTAAGANFCLERYEEALACLARMEDQSHISRIAAACWGMLGDRKKAHHYKRKTMATHPGFDVETWLSIMPVREQWQKDQYREGLRKAGFS